MPPRKRRTLRTTGPASCDQCRARIVFVRMTDTDRSVPVDPIPVDDGPVCARAIGPGGSLMGYVISKDRPASHGYNRFMPHPATCASREKAAPKPKAEPAPTLFEVD